MDFLIAIVALCCALALLLIWVLFDELATIKKRLASRQDSDAFWLQTITERAIKQHLDTEHQKGQSIAIVPNHAPLSALEQPLLADVERAHGRLDRGAQVS